jgi:iron-sulfur cluster assembly protein
MITLTIEAAKQVRIAAQQNEAKGMALRLAAKQNPDGSLDYGMGFDEIKDDDMLIKCEGIDVIFAPEYGPLLNGATLDFVEMEPNNYSFIFMNPNDANYTPPASDNSGGGCSSGGCGSCH